MSNERNRIWQNLKKTTEIVLVENGKVKYGLKIYPQGEKMPPVYKTEKINTKIGVAIAIKGDDGKVVVGWSKRHDIKEPRRFNAKFGLEIAKGRALSGYSCPVPKNFKPYVLKFVERVLRYFKVDRKDVFVTGIDI